MNFWKREKLYIIFIIILKNCIKLAKNIINTIILNKSLVNSIESESTLDTFRYEKIIKNQYLIQ